MDIVKEASENGVYTIVLNRPRRKNALDTDLLTAFHGALEHARDQRSSIVVIRGAEHTFCAGGDIAEFRGIAVSGASMDAGAEILHKSILVIRMIDAIVIAVLEGVVVGAGIGISMASDLSVASTKTILNMGYRRIGLTPDGGSSMLLARLMGAKRFNEFYLSSRNMGMEEARALGIVKAVWEEEELEHRLNSMVEDLKGLPIVPVSYHKDLVNDALFPGLEAHLDKEKRYLSELGKRPGFTERLDIFLGKK